MIGVLKTKNVPILWVGLPALRGPKATSDMLFLDSLYRESASKAGITYVDVWDGFVDEGGRFMQQGPDFEGQTRRLRTSDGVFFTKRRRAQAGALCRPRDQAAAGEPRDAGRAAERSGHARHQHQARCTRAASARRPDPAAGRILGRHRSIARRRRHAPAAIDALAARTLIKGEPLARPRRTRRRFHLAAPRGRQDRRQGRRSDRCRKCDNRRTAASRLRRSRDAAEAGEAPPAPAGHQHRAGKLAGLWHAAARQPQQQFNRSVRCRRVRPRRSAAPRSHPSSPPPAASSRAEFSFATNVGHALAKARTNTP